MTEIYAIGPLRLDADACVLTRDGVLLPLGKRAVSALTILVRAAPHHVTKTRLLEMAWPGVVVEEGNLAVQILSIRRTLAAVSGSERWLETLPRRGYRFAGPVIRVSEDAPDARADAPVRSTLPEPVTSFVGRERELEELSRLVSANRLVTLTGAGGVGKTRLAMRLAIALSSGYRNGACLVELATLRDPDLVVQEAMNALALQEQPGRSLVQTLTDGLRARHLLLLLDNAEHLLPACAQLADALLRQCPRVTLLVTSRERLGVPGETTYRVPSLSVPDAPHDGAPRVVIEYESVRLFADRTRLHRPHFELTDQNARAIANVCRRLDGIPLAIELAAARVRSMSVDELDRRLDHRFALLTGGARTLPARQQTLRAAIDWSFDLLGEHEKMALCAVAVFAGGFTLEAAERVCEVETIPAHDVLDLLTSLVDKSLVAVDESDHGTRYRLLESMREYALERAQALFGNAPWADRHLACFFALAEEAEAQLKGIDQQAWLDRLETEHDNFRAALTRATAVRGKGETGLLLASAFARFWLVRGYLAEGRGWLSRLLDATLDAAPATRAKALNWAGIFAWKQGDYAGAGRLYDQSLAIRRQLGDRKGIGAVLNNQGLLAYEQGDYRTARLLHEESLAVDRELGDRWGVAVSLIHLASLAAMQGDYVSARGLNDEGLAIFRAFGDRGHVANALRSVGHVRGEQGEHEAARALYEESLTICRELGDRSGIAGALQGLGLCARHTVDQAGARGLLEDSLAIYRELGDREGMAKSLTHLGHVAADCGDHASALALQSQSLAIHRQLNDRWGIAGSIEGLARATAVIREPRPAAVLWGAAERLREEIAAPIAPSERLHYDRAVAAARAAIRDAPAFEDAWRQGRAMTLEQAIAYASRDESGAHRV